MIYIILFYILSMVDFYIYINCIEFKYYLNSYDPIIFKFKINKNSIFIKIFILINIYKYIYDVKFIIIIIIKQVIK